MQPRLHRFVHARLTALASATAVLVSLVVGAPLPAHAALSSFGPIDPSHHYPAYYDDGAGTRLQQCLDNAPICGPLQAELPNPAQPVSFPANFPVESFYWLGGTTLTTSRGQALLVMAQEGGFLNEEVIDGDQITFNRLRIRIDVSTPGHYVVTHPFGVDSFDVVTPGIRAINATTDVGCFAANCNFATALGGRVGPFLTWPTGAPAGYIGDPAIDHVVTGSPFGTNFFRIDGPNIGGVGVNTVQTNLFSVMGKLGASVPAAPSALNATAGPGAGQISLSWTAPTDNGGANLTGYRIFRGTASGALTAVADVAANVTSFVDSALGNGATRFYAVAALNVIGESARTAEMSATTFVSPSVPRSLTATAGPNPGSITLNWTAPVDNGSGPLSGYRVYRGTASGALSALTDVAATQTTFTDTGLPNGATRFYAITAINGIGESVRSAEASATTFATPAAPRSVVATAGPGRGEINVSWSSPLTNGGSPVTGYRVYAGNTSGTLVAVADLGATATSFTESALADGATRVYAITALNAVGEGLRSNEATGRTFSLASAPQAPALTRGPVAGELTIRWSAPTNNGGGAVSAYRIYRGTASGALTALADVSGSTLSFSDTGLPEGATRFYAVSAINPVGESPLSSEVSGTTFSRPSVPNTVATAAGPGAGELTVSWNAPTTDGGTPVTGYRIYRGTTAGSLIAITDVISDARSFTDRGLTEGSTQFYAVAALNAAGEGVRSPSSAATTFSKAAAPAAPAAGAGPNQGQITVSWSAPTNTGGTAITGYRVYRGTASGALTALADVPAAARSFVDSALGDGARRFYAVTALNVVGESARTAELSAVTFSRPLAPTSPSAIAGANAGQITLQWAPPTSDGGSAITAYHVYRGTAATALALIADLSGASRSFTDTGLPEGSQRFYALTAVNSVGESVRTAVMTATTFSRPSAPQNVSATGGPSNGQITVGWVSPATNGGTAVSGYRVYRGTASGALLAISDQPATARSFVDTGLPENETRFYAVAAINGVGEGVRSAEASALSLGRPTAPPATAAAGPNNGQLTVSWDVPSTDGGRAITKYRVYRGTVSGTLIAVADMPADARGFLDTSLGNGTTRYYAVSAFNSTGEGARSIEVSATTFNVPAAPENLRTSPGIVPGTVSVIWNAPLSDGGRPISAYKVYRATETGAFTLVATLAPTQKSYADSGLSPLSKYRYRVVAANSIGDGTAAQVCTKLFPLSLLGSAC